MNPIKKLDASLSNKIAAGEVVERPASVVKELVENAVDAGSTKIRIAVAEGGLQSISVLDNGAGIRLDELEAAFSRHATSKIQSDRDLFRIRTLGFRGEALPSIASVSRLTLMTSPDGAEGGKIVLHGGEIQSRTQSPPKQGTEVIVEDLFYNTPARLKYLKTIHTELGHISDSINRFAMAHPEIAFELTHDERTLLKTSGSSKLLQVLQQIYGLQAARGMRRFEAETDDFTIEGYAGSPVDARASRSYLTFVFNGRYVRSIPLAKAVQAGYDQLLPIGKYPICCVHVTLHPLLMDVNVHPSKLEIRLSKEKELQHLLEETIRGVWNKEAVIPSMQEPFSREEPTVSGDNASSSREKAPSGKSEATSFDFFYPSEETSRNGTTEAVRETIRSQPETQDIPERRAAAASPDRSSAEVQEEPAVSRVPELHVIGQFHGTYILAQNDDGFFMIDQHAAQERINFEYFLDKLSSPSREMQDLLVPITMELSGSDAAFIDENKEVLAEAGLVLEHFGGPVYRIRSCPVWFPEGMEKETAEELMMELKQHQDLRLERVREDAAAMMACKAAVKANHHLQNRDMEGLIREWSSCRQPFTCPHGRPVMIHYSVYEIEKMFKRVMN
ncbi:DNA mismatch repair endonuclease MutL [Alkalicoccus urumqiensis]|uniref:DNA mismatch repair protein MutL n=1 Tax=Alkalicoccus urumqiensis TaxID=1548213 RepID=A0A2P6MFZ8_ALKUR|nr:DNA mismatch repair endonuclease MutL [Alkalicoccus urumqiensis]PRO65160.1 DNA mismatch repair endonuclease MutL [Alkalicoccus urumqiensis]